MTIIWYVIDRQYVADFIMPFKVIVTINCILVKSYNSCAEPGKISWVNFFLNWRGCFSRRLAKSIKFSRNRIFELRKKFPLILEICDIFVPKYCEPCLACSRDSGQVNLPSVLTQLQTR